MGPGGKSMLFDRLYQIADGAQSTWEKNCGAHLGGSNPPHDP